MGKVSRSILPIQSSIEDAEEYSVEYSFAMEYTGPPVSYDLPRAAPVEVGRIPTASVVSEPSGFESLSLPVIHPVASKKPNSVETGTYLGSSLIRTNARSPGSPNREGSFVSLGFSDSREDSQDLSVSSEDNNFHEIVELGSEGSGIREGAKGHENQAQIMNFLEPESSARAHEGSGSSKPGIGVQERKPTPSPRVKNGLCHRCLKGNRFTDKETCVVCDAKYCKKCVIRVMGSMPEGRKCITCIGRPIDESKRGDLGKRSRLLKRLLSDFEVKRVMLFEVSCDVNQPSPWFVFVNGKPLSMEEVVQLQSCANPPKGLSPGSYWYDKLSGFWGKEGHKPCQIISPQLSVGGPIKENASNGNTKVKINNREITKPELLMLKLAGINYKGCPSFWVSHDGSYQEEGQNQVKGKIWEKTGIKTICALLSLPVPSESFLSSEESVVNDGSKFGQKKVAAKPPIKILLGGPNQSGTSTIFKQAKILYNVPFSEDERQNIKLLIQSNLYRYIGILLEGREKFEEEFSTQMRRKLIDQPSTSATGSRVQNCENNVYSLIPRLKAFSDWLLQVIASGNLEAIFPAATREFSPRVEELWKDEAFQATYGRRHELSTLPTVAAYFLPRAVEISRDNYDPSDVDILYADGITLEDGLTSMEFAFPTSPSDSFVEPTEQNDSPQRYQLIRAPSNVLGENCKWLTLFDDVDLVLFCVDLTSYDEFHLDAADHVPRNRMLESKRLFETIVTHPTSKDKAFLLVLTKFDLLQKKIERVPLTRCGWFHDFRPFVTGNGNVIRKGNASVGQYGFQYMAAKFKAVFRERTGRKLYVAAASGRSGESVDAAVRYGTEVLRWVEMENKPNVSAYEWSSESAETTL